MDHIKLSDIMLALRSSLNHLQQTGYRSCILQMIRNEIDWLIPWIEILVEKLTALQLAKKWHVLYGTKRLDLFTRTRHWFVS
jgi:hypothetical protein